MSGFQAGDVVRWEWTNGTTSMWMRLRLIEQGPEDFPMGWKAEILQLGGHHTPGDPAWIPDLTGELINVEPTGLMIIKREEQE